MRRFFASLIVIIAVPLCAGAQSSTLLPSIVQVKSLKDMARATASAIKAQESRKDATCWTTVRMMEQYYSTAPVDNMAALLKIEAIKNLIYKIWRHASVNADSCIVHRADIESALSKRLTDEELAFLRNPLLPGSSPLSVSLHDYHKVTENKRIILSILFDAIGRQGLFAINTADISPMDPEAADLLGRYGTVLNLKLLRLARQVTRQRGGKIVLPKDIRAAYSELSKFLGVSGSNVSGAANCSTFNSTADNKFLVELSREIIENKTESLRKWNSAVWKDTDDNTHIRNLLERIAGMPISPQAFKYLMTELEGFIEPISLGGLPAQYDEASNYAGHNWQPKDGRGGPTVLTVSWINNIMQHVFPVKADVRGDITVTVADSDLSKGLAFPGDQTRQVKLLGPDLDAVRDTTVHWILLKRIWQNRKALPLDPFAAELLSERVSEFILFMLQQAAAYARELHKDQIGLYQIIQALDVHFISSIPVEKELGWDSRAFEAKDKLLKRYPVRLFREITKESGISAKVCDIKAGSKTQYLATTSYSQRDTADKLRPYMQVNAGSGIAVTDINNDSLPDLFFPGSGCNRLYLNLGKYRFKDITDDSGINDTGYDSHHALFADIDNDGLDDLLIVHRDTATRLFRQTRTGHFKDVTAKSGIKSGPAAHTAVFFDYDNDGLLDLFIGHYGSTYPSLNGLNGNPNQLYHNEGAGRFKDVSVQAGISSTSWTLAAAAFDVNSDGFMDLFNANDFGYDTLFINQRDGTFREQASKYGVDDRGNGMNASLIDINHDRRMDIYVSVIDMFSKSLSFVLPLPDDPIKIDQRILKSFYYLDGNQLMLSSKDGRFKAAEAELFEPGDRGWAWGATFFDYENDGDLDMYLANGWTEDAVIGAQRNQFFINDNGRFYLDDKEDIASFSGMSRAVLALDLSGSGTKDLVVTGDNRPARLFKNLNAFNSNWIKIALTGRAANHNAVGALVSVYRDSGPVLTQQVTAGANYLTGDDRVLTFGLGESESVKKVEVVWPGGKKEIFNGPFKARQILKLKENTT
ncbi:MAG: CRTAC1 family protein [Candidatus Dadabacteria bacterium]|nr:MAG: CRTAC1 family protein [Candidatus Dadabacteria bacterium]